MSSNARASSICGAHAPSSPLPAAIPLFFKRSLTFLWTAAFAKTASSTSAAPPGTIRNSWISVAFAACAPPPITLPSGSGISLTNAPPRYRKSGRPSADAAALAFARESATATLAPIPAKFSVPSISRELVVKTLLVRCVHPDQRRDQVLDSIVDCRFWGQDFCFRRAGACTARGCCPAKTAGREDLGLDRRVSPAVKDRPQLDCLNGRHAPFLSASLYRNGDNVLVEFLDGDLQRIDP